MSPSIEGFPLVVMLVIIALVIIALCRTIDERNAELKKLRVELQASQWGQKLATELAEDLTDRLEIVCTCTTSKLGCLEHNPLVLPIHVRAVRRYGEAALARMAGTP